MTCGNAQLPDGNWRVPPVAEWQLSGWREVSRVMDYRARYGSKPRRGRRSHHAPARSGRTRPTQPGQFEAPVSPWMDPADVLREQPGSIEYVVSMLGFSTGREYGD